MLGDEAYGDNTALRERLYQAGREYVLAVGAQTTVYALRRHAHTLRRIVFNIPARIIRSARRITLRLGDRAPSGLWTVVLHGFPRRLAPQMPG